MDLREELSKQEEEALRELICCCNAHDGTRYFAGADGDLYLLDMEEGRLSSALVLYRLGETRQGRQMEELAAFTRPELRRQGRFRRGLESLKKRGCGLYKLAVYENEAARACLEALHAQHEGDELLMSLSLAHVPEAPYPPGTRLMKAEGKAFGREGEAYWQDRGKELYIYGVLTYPSHRRKGFAKALLGAMLSEGAKRGAETALLQVSSENLPALRLYESLGFQETERIENWYLESNSKI